MGEAETASGARCAIGRLVLPAVSASLLWLVTPHAWGHGDHPALPTTGATVNGNLVLLSEAAHDALGLELAVVTLKDLQLTLRVPAQVELPWSRQAIVSTLAAGRVRQVLAVEGQTVRAGQTLAEIQSVDLENLQLEMLQTAAEVELAAQVVDRRRPLAESGGIAGISLLESETQLHHKRLQLEMVRRKLGALGLSDSQVDAIVAQKIPISAIAATAPISGLVASVNVESGEFVDTNSHLFHIVDLAEVLIVGEVLEGDAEKLAAGQQVNVAFAGTPVGDLSGRIERIRLKANRPRRSLEVVARLHNPGETLRPGQAGLMTIQVESAPEAIACPASALIERADGLFALVRDGRRRYERRQLRVGMRAGDWIEIHDGLFPGDRVVVQGAALLESMFHRGQDHHDHSSEAHDQHTHADHVHNGHTHNDRSHDDHEQNGHTHDHHGHDNHASSDHSTSDHSHDGDVHDGNSHDDHTHEQHGHEASGGKVLGETPLEANPPRARSATMLQGTIRVPVDRRGFVSATLEGRVAAIHVEPGQTVAAGQVLAELDSQHLRNLQLDYLEALEFHEWLEDLVDRSSRLAGRANFPQSQLLEKQTELQRLSYKLESLRRSLTAIGLPAEAIDQLRSAHHQQHDHAPALWTVPLRAGLGGQVCDFQVVPGQVVHRDDVLFEIHDRGTMWVEAYAFQQQAAFLAIGNEARVTVPGFPSIGLGARISRLAPQLKPNGRVLAVWLEIENPDLKLREGMATEVHLVGAD